MRVFLGGVVAGCLSSVGLLAANSFWDQHSDLLQEQKNEQTFTDAQKSPLSQPLQDNGPRIEKVLAHGWPSGGRIRRHFKNHMLEYDCASKVPVWVAEHLTQDTLQGAANRTKSKFKMDPDVPAEFSAKNSDYQGSGWSRGHMAPAGDNKMSQESMDETFFLTNILPQDIDNNGGFWNRLEMFCRDLTEQFQDVWVTSGPVFLPTLQDNGKKIMSYEVIGDSEVAVPTHLYKVIVAQNSGGELLTGTFIVPNKPLDYSHHLTKFQVPLEHLEKKVGTKFYSNLNREETRDLCEVTGCNLITKVEMDQIIFSSRLKRAGNVEKLAKIWKEIKEREIPVEGKLQDLYQKRLSNLSEVAEACVGASSPAVKRAEVPSQ